MKTNTRQFIVPPKKTVKLKDLSTPFHASIGKEEGKEELEEVKKYLSVAQEKLYASAAHAVLIIFQAMDAGGKDSAIEHVMSGINPQGVRVYNFKAPTAEEYRHDFLWRHYNALPERGMICIHNRSHYENVIVSRVHPEYILKENIPGYDKEEKIGQKFWDERYESIKNFEKHLIANGTTVLKFFLNVSRKEQKERFLERIEEPDKNWKFMAGDIAERNYWSDYMKAYEAALSATSTKAAPWYVIPADKKWYARFLISKIIEEKLTALDLKFPVLQKKAAAKLNDAKKMLADE